MSEIEDTDSFVNAEDSNMELRKRHNAPATAEDLVDLDVNYQDASSISSGSSTSDDEDEKCEEKDTVGFNLMKLLELN